MPNDIIEIRNLLRIQKFLGGGGGGVALGHSVPLAPSWLRGWMELLGIFNKMPLKLPLGAPLKPSCIESNFFNSG